MLLCVFSAVHKWSSTDVGCFRTKRSQCGMIEETPWRRLGTQLRHARKRTQGVSCTQMGVRWDPRSRHPKPPAWNHQVGHNSHDLCHQRTRAELTCFQRVLPRVADLVTNVDVPETFQPRDAAATMVGPGHPCCSKAPYWVFNDRRVVPECTPS